MRKLVPNIPFQMLLRGANGVAYKSLPDNAIVHFCKQAKKNGMDIFRVFDALNDIDQLEVGMKAVKEAGGVLEATVCYSGDSSLSSPWSLSMLTVLQCWYVVFSVIVFLFCPFCSSHSLHSSSLVLWLEYSLDNLVETTAAAGAELMSTSTIYSYLNISGLFNTWHTGTLEYTGANYHDLFLVVDILLAHVVYRRQAPSSHLRVVKKRAHLGLYH